MRRAMTMTGACLSLMLWAALWAPAAGAAEVLVRNATIWTAGGAGILTEADLHVRDAKIVAVGRGLRAANGATVIDATGRHVVDGSVNEGSNNITAEVRIGDVIDPDDIALYRELAGGLTAANILHGSANSIGGQNQVIKLRWGAAAEGLKIDDAPPGIKFALGENPKRANFQNVPTQRYPQTRMGVEQSIRERFLAARDLLREQEAYRKLSDRQKERVEPPRRDLQLEALGEILQGRRLVHSHCYRQDEILMLIRLAEEFGFTIATFQHVLEGYKVADEIAAHGAGASAFSDWWAYKLEAWDAIPYNGALMAQRGVLVSFNSDSNELARRMNLEAAKAVRYGGMSREEAIKLVTINPARQLRIDHRTGSLAPGKDADFVIWSGDPFSVYTIAEQTWVEGVRMFDRQADLKQREAIEQRRAELIAKVKDGGKTPSGGKTPTEGKAPEGGKTADDSDKKDEETPDAPAPAAAAVAPAGGGPAGGNAARPLFYHDRLADHAVTIAIVGATVHTVSGPEIADGTVIIERGRITAVGRRPEIPPDAAIVRGAGLHLYPGMIDAGTVLGLSEIGSVRGSVDTTEIGRINAALRVEPSINPASELIPVARSGGITHVLTAPRGGLIAGSSAVIRLDGWTWEDLAAAAPAAMHVRYPRRPREATSPSAGPGQSKEEQEKERKKDLALLAQTLESARAYRKAAAAGGASFERDPALEALGPVLDGAIPVIVTAGEIRQIKDALAWARKEGLRIILESTTGGFGDGGGGLPAHDVWRVIEDLKRDDIPVIYGPVLSDDFRRDEPYDTAYTVPLKLHEAGVRFCIINGGSWAIRNLPHQAGMAAAFGLPNDVALKAVTLYPAEILGLSEHLGSIAVGKSGSVILTDGDPLEITTRVVRMFIDGREADLDNRHLQLYEKYRRRPLPVVAR